MKFTFLILSILFTTTLAQAYELSVTEISTPYEIVPIDIEDLGQKVLLGSLEEFPVMYELKVSATTTLTTQLAQVYEGDSVPVPFSLLIVSQNPADGGVTEVARIMPQESEWLKEKDSVLGISFWESPIVNTEIGKGIYRLEVSTPNNQGKYSLMIGENTDNVGYLSRLQQIYTTQSFFDYYPFRLIYSSYIYYPLGIILLFYGFYRVRKYRRTLDYVA